MKPLFLFSLPRSGSTLLQRMLAASPHVATVSEPWVLLPILYPLHSPRGVSEYGTSTHARALSDFCDTLDGGRGAYLHEAAELAKRLYRRSGSAADAQYFLDKTPRYHLIIDEILEAFDDARLILLWRNPLAVTASMMQTFTRGRWGLQHYYVDLYGGVTSLTRSAERYGDRLLTIRFEDLVTKTASEVRRICQYLDIPPDANVWSGFNSVKLDGSLGDPTGVRDYDTVSAETTEKWKKHFCNPLRRAWARRYLDWIGPERLALMGYDADELTRHLNSARGWSGHLASDAWRMPYAGLRRRLMEWTLNRKWP